MTQKPEWLVAALARIEARRPKPEIMDTQEKADAEGVRLGDTVMRYAPPEFVADPQQALDEWLRTVGWCEGA